jgi:hypothetical protein
MSFTSIKSPRQFNILYVLSLTSELYVYWSKNFSHSAYKKSEAKMVEIDIQ